jgi:D-mannonate dehydratase
VEDESIMGSCEKQVFYVKEMLGDLNSKSKPGLDPFMMAKLDIQTISSFNFPVVEKANNKYQMMKKGITGREYQI